MPSSPRNVPGRDVTSCSCPELRAPRGEQGFTVIEVVIAASLFLVISLASAAAIDVAESKTGEARARVVAQGIAEEELEQLRTRRMFDDADLSSTRTFAPRVVRVGDGAGLPYSVRSRATLLPPSPGEPGVCAQDPAPGQILLTTTVRSGTDFDNPTGIVGGSGSTSVPSVRASSLMSLPRKTYTQGSGSFVREVVGRDGATPVEDVTVSLAAAGGGATGTSTTDAKGCASFFRLAPGAYVATIDRPGWVGVDRAQTQTVSATVAAEKATVASKLAYAPAGELQVAVTVAGRGASSAIPSRTDNVRLTNLRLPAPLTLPVGDPGTNTTIGSLFPSDTAYGVATGNCAPPTAAPVASRVVDPEPTASLTVQQPALNARLASATATALGLPSGSLAGARVVATRTDAGTDCTPTPVQMQTDPEGYAGRSGTDGTTADDGVPFGTYRVCAQYPANGTSTKRVVVNNVVRTATARPTSATPITGTVETRSC